MRDQRFYILFIFSCSMLVHVMDAVRAGRSANGGPKLVRVELFPDVSVGDAPVRTKAAS